MYVFTEAIT